MFIRRCVSDVVLEYIQMRNGCCQWTLEAGDWRHPFVFWEDCFREVTKMMI